jgi:hypothetical protein
MYVSANSYILDLGIDDWMFAYSLYHKHIYILEDETSISGTSIVISTPFPFHTIYLTTYFD